MYNIAIDGPSGAGKSTLSKTIAKELGFIYVDTGALYRAVGLYLFRNQISPDDRDAVVCCLPKIKVEFSYIDDLQHVFLNTEDVTNDIRLHQISEYASKVSAIREVREFLLQMQRDIALNNDIIMDGRDIGTVVLPDADIKIFLTASPEERAKRRYEELILKGQSVEYNTILNDIIERDRRDENREVSPLKKADDAICLDTSNNTFEQSVSLLLKTIKEQMK